MKNNNDTLQDIKCALAALREVSNLESLKHVTKLALELQEQRPVVLHNAPFTAPFTGYVVFAPKLNVSKEIYENPSLFFDSVLSNWNHLDWSNTSAFKELLNYLDTYRIAQENNNADN